MKKIAIVVGTRPEAIKMAPLYIAMKLSTGIEPFFITTAQHREMLDQVLSFFDIKPFIDLNLMKKNQTLVDIFASVLKNIESTLRYLSPEVVLVHGDTTTCLSTAIAAFYENIPIGHVEAGLRTYNFKAPWPEEMNRRLVDPISRWCFAPTYNAANNLKKENIPVSNIFVTGNTIVDSINYAKNKILTEIPEFENISLDSIADKKIILVTGHRRESFGAPFEQFCHALCDIAKQNENIAIVYPVHLNPNVQKPVYKILGKISNIHLIEPLDYMKFIYLMNLSFIIITDSGGIQEEAPSFGKPVLVTRTITERPEGIESGVVKLVGMSRINIVEEVSRLLNDHDYYCSMTCVDNPYGDGKASERIINILSTRY